MVMIFDRSNCFDVPKLLELAPHLVIIDGLTGHRVAESDYHGALHFLENENLMRRICGLIGLRHILCCHFSARHLVEGSNARRSEKQAWVAGTEGEARS